MAWVDWPLTNLVFCMSGAKRKHEMSGLCRLVLSGRSHRAILNLDNTLDEGQRDEVPRIDGYFVSFFRRTEETLSDWSCTYCIVHTSKLRWFIRTRKHTTPCISPSIVHRRYGLSCRPEYITRVRSRLYYTATYIQPDYLCTYIMAKRCIRQLVRDVRSF